MRVYVAGKWQDRNKIRVWFALLRELGYEITCDWTAHECPGEPDLATPEGQCMFQVLHKALRRSNLMRKNLKLKESLHDTDLDMHNYIDLGYACEVDFLERDSGSQSTK